MGGRGTFASGNSVKYTYQTVGYIDGVKVLQGIGNKHDLPVEAHSSAAYIQLYPDGTFKMLRIFDQEHYLIKEIAYHPETDLDPSRKPILHIHEYQPLIIQKCGHKLRHTRCYSHNDCHHRENS